MASPTMKSLGIDRLSPQEQIALAMEIWDSLGNDRPHSQLNPEQRQELARRDAEMDANPEIALTWEQVRASIEQKP
jgi:putative addiction module component (TIGR02574 family)